MVNPGNLPPPLPHPRIFWVEVFLYFPTVANDVHFFLPVPKVNSYFQPHKKHVYLLGVSVQIVHLAILFISVFRGLTRNKSNKNNVRLNIWDFGLIWSVVAHSAPSSPIWEGSSNTPYLYYMTTLHNISVSNNCLNIWLIQSAKFIHCLSFEMIFCSSLLLWLYIT